MIWLTALCTQTPLLHVHAESKEEVPFSIARGNVEFMQVGYSKHLHMHGKSKNGIRYRNRREETKSDDGNKHSEQVKEVQTT